MKIPVYQIDAFADEPFTGNPAAVCPLNEWLPDHVMQVIAREMNLSETAFFVPRHDQPANYDLRWFTPSVEVDLCGHATLASGHVILNHIAPHLDALKFHTRSGVLGLEPRRGMFELDFPANPPVRLVDPGERALVAQALGAEPIEILHANTTVAVFESENDLVGLRPDFANVAKLKEPWVVTTAVARSQDYDFVSRFFAPTAGIDEDPATGSSHTILMPYWADRLGSQELIGRQVSTRGGTMHCRLNGDRVKIGGNTIEILSGELSL